MTHKNVANLVCMSPGNLGIRPGNRVGQVLNISFDMGMLLPGIVFICPPIARCGSPFILLTMELSRLGDLCMPMQWRHPCHPRF